MSNFKLEPADFLVNINRRKDPISAIKRWAVGEYSHVFAYLGILDVAAGNILISHPFLYESSGRGVVIQSLSNRYGEEVVVMRLRPGYRDRIPLIIGWAIELASDPQSYYDYMCIPLNIIPRVLHDKFGMPLPVKYHRDEKQVCSEACAEICWRAKVPVLPENVVPLPVDFATNCPLLEEVNRGILSADWV
jgi:hypothetical protein